MDEDRIKIGYGLELKSEVFKDMKEALSRLQSKVDTLEAAQAKEHKQTKDSVPVSSKPKAPAKPAIPNSILKLVSKHLDEYEQLKKLEARVAARKEDIEEYMRYNGLNIIEVGQGSVCLRESERPQVTSRYTKYDYYETIEELPDWAIKRCTKKVIDGESLEDLVKKGRLYKRVLKHKVTFTHRSLYTNVK